MAQRGQRNHCLDYVKGIACIFVVFMHCEFPGYMGTLVQCISRFSVPFFFMVSGYFCYQEGVPVDYKKKLKHIGTVTFGAVVFYTILNGYAIVIHGSDFSISSKQILNFLLFNKTFLIAGQMWFLFALLYDYVLFAIIEKFKWYKLSLMVIPVCLCAYITLAQGMHLAGVHIPNMIYRNFLVEGLLFFSLGYWIHRKKESFKFSNKTIIAIFIISTLLCPVERMLMGRDFGINIVTFPQVISLFLICVNNPEWFKGRLLSVIGQKYSMYVYILHPAIWHMIKKVYRIIGINKNVPALYLMPILVVCVTLAISSAVYHCKTEICLKNTNEAI